MLCFNVRCNTNRKHHLFIDIKPIYVANTEDEDQKDNMQFDKLTIPEFIINLECSDDYIKTQVMKMAEKDVQGTSLEEKSKKMEFLGDRKYCILLDLIPRLEAFRKVNADETTLLNYFDEREIHPLNVPIDQEGTTPETVMTAVKKFIGKAHNYGPTPEETAAIKKQEEETKVKDNDDTTKI